MQSTLTERFQRDVAALAQDEKQALLNVLLKLPLVVTQPHQHSGVGLRKIHSSGIFEARVGLGLRLVFGYQGGGLVCHRVASHDEIVRYLKTL